MLPCPCPQAHRFVLPSARKQVNVNLKCQANSHMLIFLSLLLKANFAATQLRRQCHDTMRDPSRFLLQWSEREAWSQASQHTSYSIVQQCQHELGRLCNLSTPSGAQGTPANSSSTSPDGHARGYGITGSGAEHHLEQAWEYLRGLRRPSLEHSETRH